MQVTRHPKNPGPAAWAKILPDAAHHPTLEENRHVDFLIIGGGFAGLTAARRISELEPTAKVAVVEAFRLAEGPAGRNSGFMIDLPHDLASDDYGGQAARDHQSIRHNRAAISYACEMVGTFGLPNECFQKIGKINAAATEKGIAHNQAYQDHLAHLNEPYDILDDRQMRELTGITYYKQGLYTPGTVMLQPAQYIQSLGAAIVSNRIAIYENSPVTALDKVDGTWRAQTTKGSISAPTAILATNGLVQAFGYFKSRVVHIFTYASMTRALSADEVTRLGGAAHWGFTPADPLGTTVRRISGIGGDRIIIRNRATYEPSLSPSERRLRGVYAQHDASFDARFPMLKGVEMEHRWGGHLALTLNGVGGFGQLEDGLYSACLQNGLGTVKGTLHGMAIADMCLKHASNIVDELLDEARPKRLPPEPISQVAATLRLKLGERAAGREL
jgi:glycine/D-amino acid oxidase-like deaminating enzyme